MGLAVSMRSWARIGPTPDDPGPRGAREPRDAGRAANRQESLDS